MKIQKKNEGGGKVGSVEGLGGGGQGGSERRIEVFTKIKKNGGGGRVGWGLGSVGVRVDVNGEVKFL